MTYGRVLVVDVWGNPPGPNARRHWRLVAADNEKWKEKAQIEATDSMRAINRTFLPEQAHPWPLERIRQRTVGKRGKVTEALDRSTRPMKTALVEIEFVLPDERDRDFDNLLAGTKPLMDGCVAAGAIADDGMRTLTERRFRVTVQPGVRKARLKFAEILHD